MEFTPAGQEQMEPVANISQPNSLEQNKNKNTLDIFKTLAKMSDIKRYV